MTVDQNHEGSVWVTGATGFIGRHLAEYLAARDHAVIGFSRSAPPDRVLGTRELVRGELSSSAFAAAVTKYGRPSTIYHLAGGPTVGNSYSDPFSDFESNVVTTAKVLDHIRRVSQDAHLVLASSAAVYGDEHQETISAWATRNPSSPYGHHKLMAEQLALGLSAAFGLRVTVLRLFSVYGPGLRKQLVFDLCSRLRTTTGTVRLGGTGRELRDWVHISDVVAAFASLPTPEPGAMSVFNLGTGVGSPTSRVADVIARAWDPLRTTAFTGIARHGDPFSLVADPESLPPGFEPSVRLVEGLNDTVEWYKEHLQCTD